MSEGKHFFSYGMVFSIVRNATFPCLLAFDGFAAASDTNCKQEMDILGPPPFLFLSGRVLPLLLLWSTRPSSSSLEEALLRCCDISSKAIRKIPAPTKINRHSPPPKTQNIPPPPPSKEEFYGHGFFPAERTHFPGAHKIGAAISGPRIADKHFTDTRIFLK